MPEPFSVYPIANIYTDFPEKFGLPRQAGLVGELEGKIVFKEEYRFSEALRGLEGFSHLWLIWQFSECADEEWHPTVRPPRLGGNKRVGVFASRSPFRPNSLGLSCVKIEKIDTDCENVPVIYVSGIDMLDGTPIFDIKPYIPFVDIKADAKEGYTEQTKFYRAKVKYSEQTVKDIPAEKLKALIRVLENDPRPSYKANEKREYALSFAGFNIRFSAEDDEIEIIKAEKY